MVMDTQRVIEALNEARSRELAVIIQYMEHHDVSAGAVGLPSFARQTRGDIWESSHGSGLGASRLVCRVLWSRSSRSQRSRCGTRRASPIA